MKKNGTIPEEYWSLDEKELTERTWRAKRALGKDLVILGHHYQRDEVIQYADFRGDSLKLSQLAATQKDARFIVFCGVHFMAETADILKSPGQTVILPDLNAGCSMADMAEIEQVEECWDQVSPQGDFLPVTYINSTAELKAFCGKKGGAVCTSSNTQAILSWAFGMGKKVLFFPDEHLGRNTSVKLGLSLDEMAVWDPWEGGIAAGDVKRARIVLWKGYCAVHQRFTVEQVEGVRKAFPGIKVIVHPECTYEVARAADEVGSTEYIIKTVSSSPSRSQWAVGTEINLVHRLAGENPDKVVISLNPTVCLCSTMYRIDPHPLLWSMESLGQGKVVNRITVPEETAHWARVALDRMLITQ